MHFFILYMMLLQANAAPNSRANENLIQLEGIRGKASIKAQYAINGNRSDYVTWNLSLTGDRAVLDRIEHVEYLFDLTYGSDRKITLFRTGDNQNFNYHFQGFGNSTVRITVFYRDNDEHLSSRIIYYYLNSNTAQKVDKIVDVTGDAGGKGP